MNIRLTWEFLHRYWREATVQSLQDLRRLDVASRPTAFGICVLGIIIGMIPLASMIAVFRLVDAVTGARAVRVLTSDLHKGLLTLVMVWLVAVVAWILIHALQGLTRKIAERTALIIFTLSVLITIGTLAPFRTLLIACSFTVLHPWLHNRRIQLACLLAHGLLAYSLFSTVTSYLLSRSLSVGSYILFLGAIFGSLTLTILHVFRHKNV